VTLSSLKKTVQSLQNFLATTTTARNMAHIHRIANAVFHPKLTYKTPVTIQASKPSYYSTKVFYAIKKFS